MPKNESADIRIRFYLHSFASAEGRRSIYIEVRYARHEAAVDAATVRMSTGKTCLPKNWNDDKERVVGNEPGRGKANDRLGGLEKLVNNTLDKAEALGEKVSSVDLKALLTAFVQHNGTPPPPAPAEPEPLPISAQPIAEVVTHWQKQMRGQRAPSYLRGVALVATTFEAVKENATMADLAPNPRTQRSDLVEQWISYLLEDIPRKGSPGEFGLDNNTVGTYIKRLRTLMQFAGVPYAWLHDELTYEIEIEPLEYEEVLQLASAELPRVQLERARDCFVFNCFTGPRYQNLKNLQPGDVRKVSGVYLLEYAQLKGRKKTKVKVALDPLALEIWQRYEGKLPVHSNQQMNTLIKEAAEIAGLTREISLIRQYSTKQVTERGPLFEFIRCHLARHTFATLLLDGQATIVEVQDSLGHSSLQSTRRYAKAREKQRHTSTLLAFANLRTSHSAE